MTSRIGRKITQKTSYNEMFLGKSNILRLKIVVFCSYYMTITTYILIYVTVCILKVLIFLLFLANNRTASPEIQADSSMN